jgi:hypothetical protein
MDKHVHNATIVYGINQAGNNYFWTCVPGFLFQKSKNLAMFLSFLLSHYILPFFKMNISTLKKGRDELGI